MRWPGGKRRRAVIAAAVLLVLLAVEARLFVFPHADTPAPADAIIVFAGPGERTAYGWDLARDGLAPVVVVSIHDPGLCEPVDDSPEEICVVPSPPTTRGEARMLAGLARERDWDHVVVVTSASQSLRAELRIERCYDGRVDMVTVREDGLFQQLYRVVYENGALLKALLSQRGC
ncbi:YdcF family protein [Jiangella asiatica]|uniref:YdcF family protein n=1 Tax=Jiangella asiatica TaxID=2530372 RepID=A0A4R5D4S5_9ACTN|nr:YdcF family protein [Jiangella asiatica]TDE07487.1 YdcF family protein [Jiangella asiatica]